MNNKNIGAGVYPKLYIIVPCFNEEAVLPETFPIFQSELHQLVRENRIDKASKLLFVDDGSSDQTWELIRYFSEKNNEVCGIRLSRNYGHQYALWAGLMECREFADISISVDCDGQDDIRAMEEMLQRYSEGFDIVYGVRKSRNTDTFFKRSTAQGYYRIMKKMGTELVYNHADYRLLSRRVMDELTNYHEVNLFLRGLIPTVGFESTSVFYDRTKRVAGESHYPLYKMIALAVDGMTSFSIRPLRMVISAGIIFALISVVLLIWAVLEYFRNITVPGWASTISAIFLIGGIQLISIGLVGEYIGKIYLEVKGRPRYIVREKIIHESKD